jgi:hypothetical protein
MAGRIGVSKPTTNGLAQLTEPPSLGRLSTQRSRSPAPPVLPPRELDRAEVAELVRSMGSGERFSEAEIDAAMAEMDRDASGEVGYY